MSEPKSFDELLWKFGKAQRDAGLYGAADNVEKYKRSCFEAEQLKAALVEMNRRAPEAGQPECIYGAGCTSDCTTHCKAAIAATEPQAQAEPAEGQEPVFYAAKENIDSPNPNAFTLVSGIKDAEYTEPLYAQPQRPAVPDAAREICRLLDDGIEIHPSAPLHLRLKKELTAAPAPERPNQSDWQDMESLPDHSVGAQYWMLLDGRGQLCKEIESEPNKRWFYGELDGAYPIDEITGWKPYEVQPNGQG